MMGVSVADARALTFHEYTAMLHIWNRRHADPKGDGPVEPPDPAQVRADMAAIAADPRMTH